MFPNAEIGFSIIRPRKGKGPGQVTCNLTSYFMKKLSSKDLKLTFFGMNLHQTTFHRQSYMMQMIPVVYM